MLSEALEKHKMKTTRIRLLCINTFEFIFPAFQAGPLSFSQVAQIIVTAGCFLVKLNGKNYLCNLKKLLQHRCV